MKNVTAITIIRDCSGSMAKITQDMNGGLKTLLQTQKDTGVETIVSLVDFSTFVNPVFSGVNLKELELEYQPLRKYHINSQYNMMPPQVDTTPKFCLTPLIPSGTTALNDAIGQTINLTGKRLADMAEEDRPNRVCIIVITDGEENASREFSLKDIKEQITHQTEKYAWDFVYLGANVDVFSETKGRGISAASSSAYMATSQGVEEAFGRLSKGLTQYNLVDKVATRTACFVIDDNIGEGK